VLRLKTIVGKAYGGSSCQSLPADVDRLLADRWREFAAAVAGPLPTALRKVQNQPQSTPGWIEGRTIFRFVHPLDPPARRLEQVERIETARQRLGNGEDFATVAAQSSQGGTRLSGGITGRRYLDDSPLDVALAPLPPATISPVLEDEEGFHCFRIDVKGAPQLLPWQQIPWPARRIVFRRVLNDILSPAPETPPPTP